MNREIFCDLLRSYRYWCSYLGTRVNDMATNIKIILCFDNFVKDMTPTP